MADTEDNALLKRALEAELAVQVLTMRLAAIHHRQAETQATTIRAQLAELNKE